MDILTIILPFFVSIATFFTGLFTGRRKRRNDCLHEMQKSIDVLIGKNAELVEVVVKQNDEIIALKNENKKLCSKVEQLTTENAGMKKKIDELKEKLSNVRTITKTK